MAKEYAGDNWQFVTLTQKVMKRERTLQRIRERGTEPSSLIPMKTARFLENLHDLDSQRLRLDWLTTRPQSDIEGLEEADRGQYALLIHDDVFIHGLALVDKAGVVAGTAISHFAENLQSTKSETKRRYRALFKALRQGIAPIRDPMLHGQGRGGVDRPGPSILTDGLWWEWVLATRAWPPHHGHELVFG